MFTRSALALLAAASVVAGSASVANAARDGHWGHGPHSTVVVSGGVVFGYPPVYPVPVVVAQPPVYYAPPPVIYTRPVVAPAPVVVAAPAVVSHPDTVPADLHLTAYKTQDLVTVVITGSNPCGNYSTSLTCVDQHGWTPTLLLRNTPGAEAAGSAAAFTLNAAVRVTHPISTISVRVADQTYQVAVTEVPLIS
jgi:hypothetical protein